MMRCPTAILSTALLFATLPTGPARADAPRPADGDAAYKKTVAPLLAKYCNACHGPEKPKADLNLAKYGDTAAILAGRKTWESVLEYVEGRDMPPAGKPKPTEAEINSIVGWLQAQLTSAECDKTLDPGRVTLRRLNRVEYNNTVKDLVGIDILPADDFPSDDVGYGFDNIGDVLSLPPILFEKYMNAAEKIAESAIALDEPDRGKLTTFLAANLPDSEHSTKHDDGRLLYTVGEVAVDFEAKAAGPYYLIAKAYGMQAGPDPVLMEIRLDGKAVGSFKVTQSEGEPGRFEARADLPAGKHKVAAVFMNDWYDEKVADPDRRDRNLVVQRIEVQGPAELEVKNLPKSHKLILGDRPKDSTDARYAAAILDRFAGRAFRRPPTKDEVDRLVRVYDLARKNGERFERGIQLGVEAALMSPHFLFKVELDRKSADGTSVAIDDHELATRLSYFLWSSMPDRELTDLARQGKLKDDAVLEGQAKRMLKDRKARALTENFAGQWLQLRNLKNMTPDAKQFPEFDDSIRAAMLKETEAYFDHIRADDRSILEFLDSDYTFLNRRLAQFYKIKGFKPGKQDVFVKWTLADGGRRGGILTQASVLTVTSNPTRTSPVKRGKYILEQILNTPPPPPPPDVPVLDDAKDHMLTGTLRQRMEQHRSKPDCSGCHARMDPLGFGLENFNAVGSWRDKDGEHPIDASGVLPNGQAFNGPRELKKILLDKSADFTRCLTEKMMTYALGRGLDYHDRCAVDRIAESVEKDGHRFGRMVAEIVKAEPFRKRKPRGTDL